MPTDIGICKLNSDGEVIQLEKEYYRQGTVFKSWYAYKNRTTDQRAVLQEDERQFAEKIHCEIGGE